MLHIHRAEQADGLVAALAALLADPLPDPFAPEVVAVPTHGMERWLTQRMSARLGTTAGRGDGVCANVEFPSPRRLAGDAVAAASGIDPYEDPWLPERAVWPLLEVVDASLGEPWLRALSAHLGGGSGDPIRRARRLSSVRHLVDLFDRYALHRPETILAWARGGDGGAPADGAWQGELWRRLRERIAQESPAERLAAASARRTFSRPTGRRVSPKREMRCGNSTTAGSSRSRSHAAATCTSSCCTRRRRCGSASASRSTRRSCAATATRPPRSPPTA